MARRFDDDDDEIYLDLTTDDKVGLADYARPLERPIDALKATGANYLAWAIVSIFGIALVLVLLGGFLIIKSASPADAKTLISETVIPFLQGVAAFAATIFAPLLAFILGYYFGEKDKSKLD